MRHGLRRPSSIALLAKDSCLLWISTVLLCNFSDLALPDRFA